MKPQVQLLTMALAATFGCTCRDERAACPAKELAGGAAPLPTLRPDGDSRTQYAVDNQLGVEITRQSLEALEQAAQSKDDRIARINFTLWPRLKFLKVAVAVVHYEKRKGTQVIKRRRTFGNTKWQPARQATFGDYRNSLPPPGEKWRPLESMQETIEHRFNLDGAVVDVRLEEGVPYEHAARILASLGKMDRSVLDSLRRSWGMEDPGEYPSYHSPQDVVEIKANTDGSISVWTRDHEGIVFERQSNGAFLPIAVYYHTIDFARDFAPGNGASNCPGPPNPDAPE